MSNVLPLIYGICLCLLTSCRPSSADRTLTSAETSRDAQAEISRQIAFVHATLVDGSGQAPQDNQTILVSNGKFIQAGPDDEIKVPDSYEVIDLTGMTVVPGLIGVHNHLHMPGVPFLGEAGARLYLAAGVITMQTCGSAAPQQEIDLARDIREGLKTGPDLLPSGPYITGPGGNPNMIIPRSESHLRDTMRYWIDRGIRWFKVYRNVRPADLEVVIDEAHQHGAKVTGHLCSVTFEQAAAMGIDGVEHGLNSASDFRSGKSIGECNGGREYIDQLDVNSAEVRQLFRSMIQNNVFMTSTLAIYESSISHRSLADARTLEMMSPAMLEEYRTRQARYEEQGTDTLRENRLKRIMAFEREFVRMGGMLVSGPDPGRHVLPGFGDQRNYELLREAGFTPAETIQIMTANGARVLGLDDRGLIRPGLRADLVILKGNLTRTDSVIRQVSQVYRAGSPVHPERLLKLLKGQIGR